MMSEEQWNALLDRLHERIDTGDDEDSYNQIITSEFDLNPYHLMEFLSTLIVATEIPPDAMLDFTPIAADVMLMGMLLGSELERNRV